MSFIQLNLDPNINKAIAACGYTQPTPIQAQSIPDILLGKDLVASAQTGTGKTAAFVLPALHRLSLKASRKTRILILTPTRELASQITKAAGLYGKFLRFNIVSLVGGMPYHQQIRELERGADIIVATPGRLMDHIEQKRVDLSQIEMLVLDEADRMLDMGFIDDVQYIAKLTPADRQTLLFSATVDSKLTTIVRHLLKNPIRIDLSSEKVASPQIKQLFYKATSPHHKLRLLKHFIHEENIFKAIIFCATKIGADKIAEQLRDEGIAAAALHGDLKQNVRNRTLDQLRRGKIQLLVATDVAARGIDVSDITHVINFDMPRFCEDYVHRIGRTGRAGKEGIAISFVLPTDMRHLQRIERYVGQRLKIEQAVDINEGSGGSGASERKPFHAEPEYRDKAPSKKFVRRDGEQRRDRTTSRDDSYVPRKKSTSQPEYRDKAPGKKFAHRDGEQRRERNVSRDDSYAPRKKSTSQPEYRDKAPGKKFAHRDGEQRRERTVSRDDSYAPRKKSTSQPEYRDRAPGKKYVRHDGDQPQTRSISSEEKLTLRKKTSSRPMDDKPKSIRRDKAASFDDSRPKKKFSASKPRAGSDRPQGKFASDKKRPFKKRTTTNKDDRNRDN